MKRFFKSVVTAIFIGLIGLQSIFAQIGEAADLSSLLENGCYPVSFTNDDTYPWIISNDGIATSGNIGNKYTASSLFFSYNSEYQTEVGFSWRNNYNWNHYLYLYVDGAYLADMTSSSWTRKRLYLPKGDHIIEFRDSISASTDTDCYGQVQDIMIQEIKEIESSVLSPDSKPLTFSNDETYPWLTSENYVSSTNYGSRNSSSRFSTSFSVDKPSLFTFEHAQSGPWDYGTDYHQLKFTINGTAYSVYGGNANSYSVSSVVLPSGDYQVEWIDSISDRTEEWRSYVKNVRLVDNWPTIAVSSPGTLGVEVLYNFDVLNDVELLAVEGTINETDWAAIKQMKNLAGLDLSAAKFNNVPDYAFDGLSKLSYCVLPEGMSSIGQYAFRGTQIWDIVIPASVTSIGQYAFASTRVKTVSFADNSKLQTIEYSAFRECTSLKEFIMPNSVTNLGLRNGYTDYNNYDASTFRDCTSLLSLVFSNALTDVPQYICSSCSNLSNVVLPNNLNNIHSGAFYENMSLRHIDFPESLRTIGDYAFYRVGLDSIILPVKLTTLAGQPFYDCDNVKYVELPSYVNNYNNTFGDCNGISTIVCKSATPPAIASDPFPNISKGSTTLHVPSFAVASYKLDPYWYKYTIQEMEVDLDFWRVAGNLMLTNNRRMNGKPDIDLYYGSQATISGNAPMEVGVLNLFAGSNSFRLLNNCESFSTDSITTYYPVSSNTWYFFTPMHDVKLSDIRHTANASFVFRYYNGQQRALSGTGNSWQNVNDGMLHAGQGYIFHCNANGDLIMPAIKESKDVVLTTGEVTKILSTFESDNSANKNWNYVGNPYPCYYDIYYMDFTAPITVRSGNNYYAYSISDDDYVLSPMQSFFVQKPDAVDNIVFRPEGRQLNSTVNRASYAKLMKTTGLQTRFVYNIELTSEDNTDRTRVVLNEAKSNDYEMDCDAAKFMSDDNSVPQLYTIDAKGNKMAINERPIENGVINLGISMVSGKTYTISSSRHDGNIYLLDNKTGKTTNLSQDSYSFTASETIETSSRFTLSFEDNNATGIDGDILKNVQIIGSIGTLDVITHSACNIQIYNVNGSIEATANKTATFHLPAGIYFVKVNGVTTKAVVR